MRRMKGWRRKRTRRGRKRRKSRTKVGPSVASPEEG
jgi:hypothetical protein